LFDDVKVTRPVPVYGQMRRNGEMLLPKNEIGRK